MYTQIYSIKISEEFLLLSKLNRDNIMIQSENGNPNCIFYLNGEILGIITDHNFYSGLTKNTLASCANKMLIIKDILRKKGENKSIFFVGNIQELMNCKKIKL